ncbi:MAG: formamidopyrimidine-DNA glycosylase [Solirubrobacterales bacterium]|nr:formamidopyrimidine-DNA glycosylase [Solirubrobacterales bacterium]
MVGRRIESARIIDERWSRPRPPAEVEQALAGRRVEAVRRRGKYLIVDLDSGDHLVMHLRMTGNLLLRPADAAGEARHLRAAFRLDDGSEVWFTDARRFGHGEVIAAGELDAYFAVRLGVEPLSGELTAEELGRRAAGRTAPLKSFLLNQAHLAGVGNIYADEALYRAELHPLSPAGSMKPEHLEALREGIVGALEAGLANGGSSIDDYRNARGERGTMQEEFLVHTREGQECGRCGETIRRIVVAGRSTYFCPGCQHRLRRRPRRSKVRGS